MKPTITANLRGTEFTFETDAYALMDQYLRSLHEAFRYRGLDADDLLSDIETRCAEILSEPRPDGSRIVTIIIVRDLIDRMGQPQEIFEEEYTSGPVPPPYASAPQSAATSTAAPPPIQKRLYRDSTNMMIGGVCSGLAVYFGWDPVWVRLIAVGLAFLSFSTVMLVYIILWIVLKPANTPYRQMQLRGVSPTLRNIGAAVTDTFHSVKNYMQRPAAAPSASPTIEDTAEQEYEFERLEPHPEGQESNATKRFAQVINKIASVTMKILLGLFGLVSIPIVIGLVISLGVMIGMPDSVLSDIAQQINDPNATAIFTNMPLMIWALVSAIIFFVIPAIAMVWMICRLIMGRRAKPVPSTPKIILLVCWLVSIISCFCCQEVIQVIAHL